MILTRRTVTVGFLLVLVSLIMIGTSASALSKSQRRNADRIAKHVSERWEDYGCLPSVAVAQAFIESGLGDKCPNNNQWGISGRPYYSTLEKACSGYMKVINNGYYKKAPFCKDYRTQLRIIIAGGYCKPAGNYYTDAVSSIQKYGWYKYDQKLFAQIKKKQAEERKRKKLLEEKKKREKLQKKNFTFTYSDDIDIDENTVYVSSDVSKDGVVILKNNQKNIVGIFDCISVKTKKKDRYKITTTIEALHKFNTKLEFREGADRKAIMKKEGVIEMIKPEEKTEAAKMAERQKNKVYSGNIHFQGREYKITEMHNPVDLKDKWVIGFELPGVVHKPQVFAFGVRYKDYQRFEGDEEKIDRPAIFNTELECKTFMEELYFPKYPLKAVQLTEDMIKRSMNPDIGAYLVQRVGIFIPVPKLITT